MSAQSLAPPPALILKPEHPADAAQIEALLDRAFGPGRFTKVSERVREIADFAAELSFCAWEDGRIVGVVRQWHVRVGDQPVVFLGPLAVDQDQRSAGVGALLVERACEAAQAAGESCVLLVGDEPYFARVGFSAAPAKDVKLPGPVDQRRVLVRAFTDLALAGDVRAPLRA
jgi:predicted N-acetyltransferase YhbS